MIEVTNIVAQLAPVGREQLREFASQMIILFGLLIREIDRQDER